MNKKIAIASDHAALDMKKDIKACLVELGYEPVDLGPDSEDSVDYPDFGIAVASKVSTGEVALGILTCGTGIGMSIVANKFPHVRAALVSDVFSARMSKLHNNANILVIGGRVTGSGLAKELVKEWLTAEFEGGRHQRRLDKIEEIEKR